MIDKKVIDAAASFHKHAKGCKHNPFDCVTCSASIEWFGRLPLQTLSILLSERPAPPIPASL